MSIAYGEWWFFKDEPISSRFYNWWVVHGSYDSREVVHSKIRFVGGQEALKGPIVLPSDWREELYKIERK